MKSFITSFILLLFLSSGFAQSVTIKVVHSTSGKAINEVLVEDKESAEIKMTNDVGIVVFSNLKKGNHSFTVSGLGITSLTQNIDVHDDDQNITLQVEKSDIQLDEVVVLSNLVRKKEFINKIDINLRPLNNSQEVLRMVPGLFIGQHAGGGKAEQIFLRGFDIDHGTDIQINVDGMPVNMVSHAHGQGYADLHFVIPELIERVDFSKGPYMAEKGNFSTAGWVDFRTVNTLNKNIVKAEIGQFDTYRLFGAVSLFSKESQVNGTSAYVAGEYNFSNSYFDAPQDFKRLNIMAKFNSKIGNHTHLTLTGSHFNSDWNHSGQIPDRAVESGLIGFFGSIDPTEGGNTSRSNINLQALTMFKDGGFLKNQLFYSQYNFELFSNFTFFLDDPIFGDQIKQRETRNIIGYNSNYTKEHKLGQKNAEFNAGLQFRYDIVADNELSKSTNRTELRERIQYGDVNEANVSLYASESIQLNQKWTVDLGARFEYFNNQYKDQIQNNQIGTASATTILPKFNVYYTHSEKTQWYLKSGKGFHSNDTRVVVPQGGKKILPAAYGTDLGMVWKPFKRLMIQPALWYLFLDQEFVYVGDAGVVEPSGKSVRMGADFSARYQLSQRLFADMDLNVTKPRAIDEPSGQQYIPLAPTFTSVFGLNYVSSNGFSGNIRGRYLGDRPANEDNTVIADGYFVTDLQLNYQKSNMTVSILINNLFNTKWKETQFNTESRLKDEVEPVEEIHFTPGSPFFSRLALSYTF